MTLADTREAGVCGYESTLWKLFDPEFSPSQELPAGAQLHADRDIHICCADPVHLRADMTTLMLVDQSQFSISDAERAAFSQLINAHIADIGGVYFFDENGRGFLGLREPRSVNTTPLSQVAGGSIFSMLPQGEGRAFWHRLMTEFQMLLHTAPFNQARMERGAPAINGLWLWGTGRLQRPLASRYSGVCCDEGFAAELARSADILVKSLPATFDQGLIPASGQRGLLVFSGLLPHSQYDDYPGWLTLMQRFCADWLAPLIDAVRRKQLSRLCLYPCDGSCYVLESGHQWRFWRRSKPLLHRCP